MVDPIDAEKARLIRYLRAKAHILAVWEAPRVSDDAETLKACADMLEGTGDVRLVRFVQTVSAPLEIGED